MIAAFLLQYWKHIACAILAVGLWGHGWIKGSGHEKAATKAAETRLAVFEADIAAKGEQARQQAIAQQEQDKKRKDSSDQAYSRRIAALDADNKRLRNARPAGSFVPAAATCPGSPERAGFDRAQLETAIRVFDAGIQELVNAGDRAIAGLDESKVWAQR